MKSTTKKILTYTIILLLIVGVLGFVGYSWYNYYLFVNINGKIIEDNPRLEKICESKPLCEVVTGVEFSCEIISKKGEETLFPNQNELAFWKGYKGCNNLTKYYREREDEFYIHKIILGVKSCSCRNIIG